MFELTVRDGAGFVFAFDYEADTPVDAVKQFKTNCRRNGLKTSNMKILKVRKLESGEIPHCL